MRRSATGDATRSTAHRFGASATNISRRSTLSITGRVSVSRPKVPGLDSHSHACHPVEISPSIAAASPACLPPPFRVLYRFRPVSDHKSWGKTPIPFAYQANPSIPSPSHLFCISSQIDICWCWHVSAEAIQVGTTRVNDQAPSRIAGSRGSQH